jgi:hypothetical protein
MQYVMVQKQKNGITKLLVYCLQRFYKCFEKAFENHQDDGNLSSQTNFLTNGILWQSRMYIYHSYLQISGLGGFFCLNQHMGLNRYKSRLYHS